MSGGSGVCNAHDRKSVGVGKALRMTANPATSLTWSKKEKFHFNPFLIFFGKSVVIESTPRSLKCLAVSMSFMVQQERCVHDCSIKIVGSG